MLALLLVLVASAAALSACGGDDEAGADSDEIAEVFDEVWAAVDDGDLEAICARLGRNGRRQVVNIGHVTLPSCERGLRELVPGARAIGVREERPGPEVLDLEVTTSAVATVKIDGRETKVPLVMEEGRWKLDAMFGAGSRDGEVE